LNKNNLPKEQEENNHQFLKEILIQKNDKRCELVLSKIPRNYQKTLFLNIAIFLKHHPKITQLEITGGNNISIANIKENISFLSKLIAQNNHLKSIHLNHSHHVFWFKEEQSIKPIANLIAKSKLATSINLKWRQIGAKGVKYLTEQLGENNTLKSVNLSFNDIGSKGAEHTADLIAKSTLLTSINLGFNRIGAVGVKHLAQMLKKNKTLETIDLEVNRIGDEGVNQLVNALKSNNSLKNINLTRVSGLIF
jgi:hypothetical protein